MLKITCHTYDKLPLDKITEFQGDLKKRTTKDTEKIINSLYANGFAFPFFIWKDGTTNYCLDGHGRIGALKELRTRGETIPDLPVVYVDADDERDARVKLLQVNSQYTPPLTKRSSNWPPPFSAEILDRLLSTYLI